MSSLPKHERRPPPSGLEASTRLTEAVSAVRERYFRLVLLVGPAGSGKTRVLQEVEREGGWPRFNVNLRLSETLLDTTRKERALVAANNLADLVGHGNAEVVLLDNVEILFAPELSIDALRLLQGLSRNRVVVAAWPGSFGDDVLTYAAPGHPEFRKYPKPDALIVPVNLTQQESG